MFVCMHVYVCVHAHMYMHVCVCACARAHAFLRIYTHMPLALIFDAKCFHGKT